MQAPEPHTAAARPATLHRQPSVLMGTAWMVTCLFGMSLMAVSVRQVARDVTVPEILYLRGTISLVVVLLLCRISAGGLAQLRTRRLPLHVARNLIHFVGQYCWFLGLTLVPLALVFAIEFTMPIWIGLLAPFILKERLTGPRIGAVALGFIGVLIAVRPDAGGIDPGALVVLGSAIGFGISVIAVKLLTETDSALSILFYMALIQTPIAWLIAGAPMRLPGAGPLAWMLVIALSGMLAQFAMARAYLYADATVIMPIDFLRLPLIAVIGALLYREPLDPFVLAGGAVIILGNWWALWAERRLLPRAGT